MPKSIGWEQWTSDQCRSIAEAGQWRSVTGYQALRIGDVTQRQDTGQRHQFGGGMVSFASNDYLGLSRHPAVVAAAAKALDRWGTGAGASRLAGGERIPHLAVEAAVAAWKHTEAALLFPTGYAANLGVLTTFAGPGVRVVSDAANHASIVDGCRLARAEVSIYAHGDVDEAASLLAAPGAERRMLVTDTVFSMDGDLAPVDDLAMACARTGALLVLDEAHAVLGPDPDLDALDVPVLRVATLSKFLGSLGGVAAGSRSMIDLLVNRARTFIFTTATPPADAAAADTALGILLSPEGRQLRDRLRVNIDRLAYGHPSPIVPFLIGSEKAAVRASRQLADQGLTVPAIRPPTVPAGTSRLRVSVSADHTTDQIDRLARSVKALVPLVDT